MSVPLFTIGLSILWTELLISLTGMTFCKVICVFSLVALLLYSTFSRPGKGVKEYIYKTRKHKKITVAHLVFFSVCFACVLFMAKTEVSYNPATRIAEQFENEKVTVSGQIVEILPKSESGNKRYVVEVDSLVNDKVVNRDNCENGNYDNGKIGLPFGGMKIMLSSKYFKGELNDFVSFDSKLYVLGNVENDSTVSNKSAIINYYRSKGYYIGAYVYEDVERTSFEDALSSASIFGKLEAKMRAGLAEIREYTRLKLRKYLQDDYAGVTLGMLIGDKSELPEEYSESFTKAGIVHLFSVSGFHMSLWSEIVYKRLLKSGFGKRLSSLMSIIFVLLFMAVTGFSRSTIRAGIMMMVFFFGRMMFRDSDSLNSLGLSACVITLANPFCAGDVGFLLSFFSTLGIIVGVKRLMRPVHMYLRRINNYERREQVAGVISGVAVSLCAFVFTFPFVAIFIGDVSLIAPLTNLLTGTAASALVLLSGIGVFLSTLPLIRMFCYPVFLATGLLAKYIVTVTTVLSQIPYVYVGADADFITVALAAVLVLCATAFLLPSAEKHNAERQSPIFENGQKHFDRHKPAPIAFSEIYSYYGYRARLVFWLSVIIIMSGIFAYLCFNF